MDLLSADRHGRPLSQGHGLRPRRGRPKARCRLSADDVRFLAETLPNLPCDNEDNLRVTLDLNGQVAVRAKPADQSTPTEVVLTNSQFTGDPMRISVNRTYLARAMRLGLDEICLFGDETALLGRDKNRQFVWMPLSKDSAIRPKKDAIRIESPKGEPAASIPETLPPRRIPPMAETMTNTNGKPASNGRHRNQWPRRNEWPSERPGRNEWPSQARSHQQDFQPQGSPAGPRRPDRAGREVPHRGSRFDPSGERPGAGAEAASPPEQGDRDHLGQHPPTQGFGGLAGSCCFPPSSLSSRAVEADMP